LNVIDGRGEPGVGGVRVVLGVRQGRLEAAGRQPGSRHGENLVVDCGLRRAGHADQLPRLEGVRAGHGDAVIAKDSNDTVELFPALTTSGVEEDKGEVNVGWSVARTTRRVPASLVPEFVDTCDPYRGTTTLFVGI